MGRFRPGNSLRRSLEALEPHRKSVPVRAVLGTAWQVDGPPIEAFQGVKHRTVALTQQAVSNMQAVVWVDADQMGVKGRMMDFRQRKAIGYHRLAEPFVLVRDDMSCV